MRAIAPATEVRSKEMVLRPWLAAASVAAIALAPSALGACGSSASSPTSSATDASGDAPGPGSGDDANGPGDAAAAGDGALEASPQDSAGSPDAPRATDAGAGEGASPILDASAGEAGTMMSVYVTFYGWEDNSPPGGAIAYPMSGGYPTLHDTAGGTGTYADPITFATDKSELPVGTRLYVPFIEKYVIMEDDCVECDSDWTSSHEWHTDLWMNSNGTESPSALSDCEDAWTRNAATVEIDPPDGRTVTTRPLFDPSTNTCRTTP